MEFKDKIAEKLLNIKTAISNMQYIVPGTPDSFSEDF